MEMEWSEETILACFWNYLQAFLKRPSNSPLQWLRIFAHHMIIFINVVLTFQVRISRGNDLPKSPKPTLCQQHWTKCPIREHQQKRRERIRIWFWSWRMLGIQSFLQIGSVGQWRVPQHRNWHLDPKIPRTRTNFFSTVSRSAMVHSSIASSSSWLLGANRRHQRTAGQSIVEIKFFAT